MEAGRFGEGKKNLPKKYGRRKDAAAPPVGRRSPFSLARPKLVLDSGGLLMEAMTMRNRLLTRLFFPSHDRQGMVSHPPRVRRQVTGNISRTIESSDPWNQSRA